MNRSCLRTIGFFAVLVVFQIGTGCRGTETNAVPENRTKPVKVSIKEVEPVQLKDILLLPGETEAWKDVCVAADKSGKVEWIGPREGDKVAGREFLAKIDVSALKAALDGAEAAFSLADALYQRRQRLFDRKIINKEALDHSLTEKTVAQGNLEQARVEYERGFVRSPISGRVNHLFVDEGEFVNRGEPMIDLVNVSRIRINVNVPELDVQFLKPLQKAKVTVDAFGDRTFDGTVDFVAYKADPATKTFHVRVLIDNPEQEIRPGMIARVAFVRRVLPDALVAPLFALVDKGGERLLFVEEDGIAHARTVTIGVIEGDKVQILQGLEAGDRLIVVGQTEVEEGMRVTIP